ncbi:hypothetical protein DEU56DRAFT_772003 [Suillus clintonianus]|uniref:uncharacterized protein n=1 Tax=Suillus clintonianus TaxID=1904413 RepID=UPI001B85F562|nr:uncharacterized protein DEU56DRAFT_772003 [Suillus clintonianus]KAG2153958.1 hypothetical protein DEU56DRAFT_772003 [Suillus clintonianus]
MTVSNQAVILVYMALTLSEAPLKAMQNLNIVPVTLYTSTLMIIVYHWLLCHCADKQDLGSMGHVYDFLISWLPSCNAPHTDTLETLPQTAARLPFDAPYSLVRCCFSYQFKPKSVLLAL